jgi:hypothetical protein
MKMNLWTTGLVAAGAVSLASVAQSSPVTALSTTTISGYVDTSAQWNMGTGDVNAPRYAYGGAAKADGFNLNVVKLTLEQAPDMSEWSAGYKVDLVFGPDANSLATQSSGAASDFAIKQAYVVVRAPVGNGIDFKVGVFDTIVGYESFESVNDPNFTRSYGFTISPTTHTGLLGTYQFCDIVTASVGVANTFGPAINSRAFSTTGSPGFRSESYKTYMGALALTAPKEMGWFSGSMLNGGVINGFNVRTPVTAGTAKSDETIIYAGATLNTPITALKIGLAYTYVLVGYEPDLGVKPANGNAADLYLSYRFTEKFSLNGRAEYFSQTKPSVALGYPFDLLPSKVIDMTLTAEYDLWKNVLSRVEFRWDHQADGTGRAYGQVTSADPILGGSLRNSYELIGNVIYKF